MYERYTNLDDSAQTVLDDAINQLEATDDGCADLYLDAYEVVRDPRNTGPIIRDCRLIDCPAFRRLVVHGLEAVPETALCAVTGKEVDITVFRRKAS